MNNYKNLKVWQKAVDLTVFIYEITINFPKNEIYGLTSQMRRSSVSIPSNIAEGAGRNSKKEFIHFLSISTGSSCELETQTIISYKLNYINHETYEKINAEIQDIQKMIASLQKHNSL